MMTPLEKARKARDDARAACFCDRPVTNQERSKNLDAYAKAERALQLAELARTHACPTCGSAYLDACGNCGECLARNGDAQTTEHPNDDAETRPQADQKRIADLEAQLTRVQRDYDTVLEDNDRLRTQLKGGGT